MPAARRAMLDAGLITIETKPYFNTVAQRTIAMRKPDAALLTPEELAVADKAVAAMKDLSERQAAELPRQEIGWKAARGGEAIPYRTAWLSPEPLPQEAEEYWRDFVREQRGAQSRQVENEPATARPAKKGRKRKEPFYGSQIRALLERHGENQLKASDEDHGAAYQAMLYPDPSGWTAVITVSATRLAPE